MTDVRETGEGGEGKGDGCERNRRGTCEGHYRDR
jgi:hypothetical protein